MNHSAEIQKSTFHVKYHLYELKGLVAKHDCTLKLKNAINNLVLNSFVSRKRYVNRHVFCTFAHLHIHKILECGDLFEKVSLPILKCLHFAKFEFLTGGLLKVGSLLILLEFLLLLLIM